MATGRYMLTWRFTARDPKQKFAIECRTGMRPFQTSPRAPDGNAALRGHYAYYGVAGNLRSVVKVYRVVERYWRRMLCSRSWAGLRLTWDAFNQIKERTPLLPPKLRLPYSELQALAVL
jgi:RNA-directed DNA polymerase